MGQTLKQFIDKTLISEIKTIQQTSGHHYLFFGLIAQGIELLGACLDDTKFHKKGRVVRDLGKQLKNFSHQNIINSMMNSVTTISMVT